MAENLEQLRPLGCVEKYSAVRGHLGIYLNVGVTVYFRRECNEPLKPALFRALAVVISKHPTLSAIPVDVDTNVPHFVRLPNIHLEPTVTFMEREDQSEHTEHDLYLDRFLEEQHNRPFNYETPLLPFWRLFVIEDPLDASRFTISFIFHHSIADTQSALVFYKDLEEALSHPTEALPTNIISTPKVDLLPPLEELLDLPTSAEFIRHLQNYYPSPEAWTGKPQVVPVKSQFTSLWLPSATTKAIRKIAKDEKASVTALVQSLLAACLFSILPQPFMRLDGDCAISLRRFLPSPITSSSMGCYIGSFTQKYQRGSFRWSEARMTKTTIDQTLKSKGADNMVGYLRHLPDMQQWFRVKMGRQRSSAFELSNVGRLSPLKEPLLYQIESILFSQSASACGGAVKVSVATGRDERMALGFTWQEGIVDGHFINRLVEEIRETIQEIVVSSQGQ